MLRMARRQPKFFIELSVSPRERVSTLQPPLSGAELEMLVEVVEGTGNAAPSTELGRHLNEEWLAIQDEQRRDTRHAAGAS